MRYQDYTDGYCRVSTQRQVSIGHALERYKEDLGRCGIPEERIFWDVESGASGDRSGYNQVLARVRNGLTKRVIVPCFDRFTRSPLLWEEAIRDFQRYGATLEALSGGPVDLNSPEGIYKSRIDAAAAAYVREKNQKAARDGWARRRRLQKAGNPPFGMTVVDDSYTPDHSPYPKGGTVYGVAKEVIQTFINDGTQRGALQKLIATYGARVGSRKGDDFPRDRTKLKKWLQSPILRGHTAYFGNRGRERLIIPNTHEALITPQEAEQIDRLLSAKARKLVPKGELTAIGGLVFCECGSKCIKRRKHYYCEDVYDSPIKLGCDRKGGARITDLEEAAILAITTQAATVAHFVEVPIVEETPEIQELQRKLFILGDDPDFDDSRNALKKKIENLKHHLIQRSNSLGHRRAELVAAGADPGFWQSLSDPEKRFVFLQLVDKVIKSRDKVLRVELAPGLGHVSFEDGDDFD